MATGAAAATAGTASLRRRPALSSSRAAALTRADRASAAGVTALATGEELIGSATAERPVSVAGEAGAATAVRRIVGLASLWVAGVSATTGGGEGTATAGGVRTWLDVGLSAGGLATGATSRAGRAVALTGVGVRTGAGAGGASATTRAADAGEATALATRSTEEPLQDGGRG